MSEHLSLSLTPPSPLVLSVQRAGSSVCRSLSQFVSVVRGEEENRKVQEFSAFRFQRRSRLQRRGQRPNDNSSEAADDAGSDCLVSENVHFFRQNDISSI